MLPHIEQKTMWKNCSRCRRQRRYHCPKQVNIAKDELKVTVYLIRITVTDVYRIGWTEKEEDNGREVERTFPFTYCHFRMDRTLYACCGPSGEWIVWFAVRLTRIYLSEVKLACLFIVLAAYDFGEIEEKAKIVCCASFLPLLTSYGRDVILAVLTFFIITPGLRRTYRWNHTNHTSFFL